MNTLRRVAVIDCGTNTFNLRIVDVGASAGWIPVFGQRVAVKLGQGGVAKGIITADRMARGLDALIAMREAIRNYRVEEVHVMATSAMRDAKNGHDFVQPSQGTCWGGHPGHLRSTRGPVDSRGHCLELP